MTLQRTLWHSTSKSPVKWCLHQRKKSTWKPGMRKPMGIGVVSLNIIIVWGEGGYINFCLRREGHDSKKLLYSPSVHNLLNPASSIAFCWFHLTDIFHTLHSLCIFQFHNFFCSPDQYLPSWNISWPSFIFIRWREVLFFSHSKSINFRPPLNRDVLAAWLPKRTKNSREKYRWRHFLNPCRRLATFWAFSHTTSILFYTVLLYLLTSPDITHQ